MAQGLGTLFTVAVAGSVAAAGAAPPPAMLPPRLLDCSLARITNFDPGREQKPSDYALEGHHALQLFLPAIPQRTAPPPDATDAAEPVDPRTRVLRDPDHVAGDPASAFERVVDDWPRRIEMTRPAAAAGAVNLIIVDGVDTARGTANMFVTVARDAITYDHQKLFVGTCRVGIAPPAA
jgi:hypothetical protein